MKQQALLGCVDSKKTVMLSAAKHDGLFSWGLLQNVYCPHALVTTNT